MTVHLNSGYPIGQAAAPAYGVMDLIFQGLSPLQIIDETLPKASDDSERLDQVKTLSAYLSEDHEVIIDKVLSGLGHFSYFHIKDREMRSNAFESLVSLAYTYRRYHIARELAEQIYDPTAREKAEQKIDRGAAVWHTSIVRDLEKLSETDIEQIPGYADTLRVLIDSLKKEGRLQKEICDRCCITLTDLEQKISAIIADFSSLTAYYPTSRDEFEKRIAKENKLNQQRVEKIEEFVSALSAESSLPNSFFRQLHKIEKAARGSLSAMLVKSFRCIKEFRVKYRLPSVEFEVLENAIDDVEREFLEINRIYRECVKLSKIPYSEEQHAKLTKLVTKVREITEKRIQEKMQRLSLLTRPEDTAMHLLARHLENATQAMQPVLRTLDKARRELMPRS